MPRYYFHVQDDGYFPDHDGTECRDLADARAQAIVTAGEMLRDKGRNLWDGGAWSMGITDAEGQTLCEIHFATN